MVLKERAATYCCLACLALIAVLTFKTNLEDYDIWFHLKYGEFYVQNLTWHIDHSAYSWTPAANDWIYVTWLGSALLYLAHLAAGFPGVAILQWCVIIGIALLYYSYVRMLGTTLDVVHTTVLLLVTIALSIVLPFLKPEMFTSLLFAAIVFIYFHAKSSGKSLIYLYPALFLIWVNTHGAFFMGLFFVSMILALESINALYIRKNALPGELLRSLIVSVLLSYVATLANPYGIYYHLQIIQDLFFSPYMAYSSKLFAYLSIWDFFFPQGFSYKFMYSAIAVFIMAVTLFALSLYVYARDRYLDPAVLLVNLAFFLLIFKAARMVLFFPIIWLFSVPYILGNNASLQLRKKLLPVALAVFLVFGGGFFYDLYIFLDYDSYFGFNIEEWIPEKEVAFIKEKKLPGPLFNDYLSGAYIIWAMHPDYKAFVDPRYGPYAASGILGDYFGLEQPPHLQKLREKYPFNTALIHLRELRLTGLLLSLGEWRVIYFDKVAAVMVHRSAFDSLDKDTRSMDLGASRFQNIDNPRVLGNLFDLYNRMNRKADMWMIYDTHRRNVSDSHPLKEFQLEVMQQQLMRAR